VIQDSQASKSTTEWPESLAVQNLPIFQHHAETPCRSMGGSTTVAMNYDGLQPLDCMRAAGVKDSGQGQGQ
jgi:hypothetical protein